jgi:hypothetical protein
LFLAVVGGAPSMASAPRAPTGAALRIMSGDCDRLALAGRSPRGGCRPTLVNLVYASGAVSFVFAGRDGRLLSFRTDVDRQQGDQTSLIVDQVTIIAPGGKLAWTEAASGSCVLTPFAIERSRLDCSAKASGSRFSATFRTSDSRPRLLTLAGG